MCLRPTTGWCFFASKLSGTTGRPCARGHVAYAAHVLSRKTVCLGKSFEKTRSDLCLFNQSGSIDLRWAARQHPSVERLLRRGVPQPGDAPMFSSIPYLPAAAHQTSLNDSEDILSCKPSTHTPNPSRSHYHSHIIRRQFAWNSHQTVTSTLSCAKSSLTLHGLQEINRTNESDAPNSYTSGNHQNAFRKMWGPHGRHTATRFARGARAMHWRPFHDNYGRNRLTVVIKKFEYWTGMQSSPEYVVYAIIALNCLVFLLWQNHR